MASSILDHTQDLSGVETHRLTSLYAPPEFVKTASHEQLYGPKEGGLPNHVFADPVHRLYPCHTKAATWMSCLFFMDKMAGAGAGKDVPGPGQLRQIGQNIEKQARFFQIAPELDTLKAAMAHDSGDALSRLADNMFALVWENEDGSKERHYALRNGGEIKMAADWFSKYRDEFVFEDRHTMARKILDRADALELDTGHTEMLSKTAGLGYCAAATAVAAIEKRANLVARKDPKMTEALRELAKTAQAHPLETRDLGQRIKLASVLDQFDRVAHLTELYDAGGLERPEEVLFQITEKTARDFLNAHVQMTSGTVYEKSALEQLPATIIHEWMGKDLADEVSNGLTVDTDKLAAIASTLPRGDAEMFDRMAQVAGVPVLMRDKAAHATGISTQEMAELAERYQTTLPSVV